MVNESTVPLSDVGHDLLRFVAAGDREAAGAVLLPVLEIEPGELDLASLLARERAFAGVALDGTLVQTLRVGDHEGLCLLGPGDVVTAAAADRSQLVVGAGCRATASTRLAFLGRSFLLAVRRWPLLAAGLHARQGEQSDRLVLQAMICQLPRVDDRVLSLLWLLAECWGEVTPEGATAPIALTHGALGGLVGARRPTVTLALSALRRRGALVRTERGWLVLERPSAVGRRTRVEQRAPLAGA
jgi:CRP/FNR family transcriptional regulator, cyclic AMP receptor protein